MYYKYSNDLLPFIGETVVLGRAFGSCDDKENGKSKYPPRLFDKGNKSEIL